jgi:hypothetical protein
MPRSPHLPQSAAKSTWSPLRTSNTTDASRQAYAAEYVALYLDRIDSHLERIAEALAGQAHINGQIARTLSQIGGLLQQKNQ